MRKAKKINTQRILLTALMAVAFFGFILFNIQQSQSEEETLLNEAKLINSSPTKNAAVEIVSPKPNTTIKNPVKITGQAAVFEAVLQIRIKDASGLILAQTKTMTAQGQKMSPFSANVKYKKPTRPKGAIEIYSLSPKDGSEINKITIPIVFQN